jgi:hypothetical protein
MAFSGNGDKSVGQQLDELASLHHRYIDGDPALTEEQIDDMKRRTNTASWWMVQEKRDARLGKVTPISAGRTEEQIAKEIQAEALKILNQLTELMHRAKQEHGMMISFSYSQPNAFGIQTLASLEIIKKLC